MGRGCRTFHLSRCVATLDDRMRRLFLLLALSVLLFSVGCIGQEAAQSVMDKDGDGKVSTEEFLEHAQKQVG